MQEWVDACRGGPSTYSSFDIGGHITEIGLSGNLALRLQRPIDWDGQNMKVKGTNEADAFIRPNYRKKWVRGFGSAFPSRSASLSRTPPRYFRHGSFARLVHNER